MKRAGLLFVMAVMAFGLATESPAQTVISVAAGVDGISSALATAAAGSIIELTTSGGQYIETGTDSIMKNITIRAKAGLAAKPVIYSGSAEATFYLKTGSLNLQGVKLDGLAAGTPFGFNFLYWKAPATGVSSPWNLKVDKCEFWNSQQRAITCSDATLTALDSMIVTNSIFKNTLKQPFYLKATRNSSNIFPGSYKYALIENCLMVKSLTSTSDGYATYIEPGNRDSSGKPYPKVIINHVTVDSCMGGGINTYTTSNALVQNCIVTNSVAGKDTSGYSYALESGRWVGAPPANLKNSLYYNNPAHRKGVNLGNSAYSLAILTNVQVDVDPMYNNVAAGDYSLKAASPAKGKGTDGKDLGYIASGLNDVKQIGDRLPEAFQLSQNYPNPFNPATTIEFSAPSRGQYSIKVYDMLGQEVANVFNQEVTAGSYSVHFDGSRLASGLYVYTLRGNNVFMSKSMMLLK